MTDFFKDGKLFETFKFVERHYPQFFEQKNWRVTSIDQLDDLPEIAKAPVAEILQFQKDCTDEDKYCYTPEAIKRGHMNA